MESFKIKFWGVRGSYPVSGADTTKIGGNTSCVEIRINGKLIIIDAGTGIIKLGNELVKESIKEKKSIVATILFSHMHHDHNQGFPFFKPAYIGSSILYLFGPKFFQEDMEEVLARAMLPPFFPVELSELNSARIIRSINDSEIIIMKPGSDSHPQIFNKYRDDYDINDDDIEIEILKGYAHPKGGIIFYKIKYKNKSVVYASDTEGYLWGDQKLIEFSKNCDILIHDVQFTAQEYRGEETGISKQGYGHSTPEMAIDIVKKSNAKKLVLFHHDPEHSDSKVKSVEKACQRSYSDSIAAYEGLELTLM